MKSVYSARDPLEAHVILDLLANNGIESVVQGERLFELQGKLPVVYPSVCVRDEDFERARAIIKEHERSRMLPDEPPPWKCPTCSETIAGTFGECWKCEGEKEEVPTSSRPQPTPFTRRQIAFMALLFGGIVTVFMVLTSDRNELEDAWRAYDLAQRDFDFQHYDDGIAKLNAAINSVPGVAEFHSLRGWAYQATRRQKEALADFNQALALNPSLDRAYLNRGYLYLVQHRLDEAITDCSKAIQLNPNESDS